MEPHFKKEFNDNFKSGDKIIVKVKRFDNSTRVLPQFLIEENVKLYEIGRTDLDDAHGQVELKCGNKSMIVEYQWFNELLTSRKITKIE